jgi:DNA-binding LytR/AlgR family response regulator
MIKTILIEDAESIAIDFARLLKDTSSSFELVARFDSVEAAVNYLGSNPEPDLVFSDVHLRDGLAFDIFNKARVNSPVVFMTGYDQYLLNAFEHNGIDYLFKPVDQKELKRALDRYQSLEQHFIRLHSFVNQFRQKHKTRLVVRKGIEHVALRVEDIALIYTEEKLVFVIDRDGRKYIADKKMVELQHELDDSVFFRANRQYLVNIGYIRSYRTFEKVKLQVDLLLPQLKHHIVVSQETAPWFKRWIHDQ